MIEIGNERVQGMPAYMLDCRALAEMVVAEFDAAGVSAAVVVQEYMDGPQNEYLAEVVKRWPGRFFAHGLANFFAPDAVADEAFELLDRGFRGLKLPADHLLGKLRLDDERFMPIWRRMERDGCVLAVDLSEGANQVPQMEAILAACPQLKVALGHFGMPNRGGWPGQLRLARHANVYLETGGIIWLYRREQYPFSGAVEAIVAAAKEVGMEKLMWGSDWPRTMVDFTYRQSLDFIRQSDRLSDRDKALLLGGNAQHLYGFSPPSEPPQPATLITEG